MSSEPGYLVQIVWREWDVCNSNHFGCRATWQDILVKGVKSVH